MGGHSGPDVVLEKKSRGPRFLAIFHAVRDFSWMNEKAGGMEIIAKLGRKVGVDRGIAAWREGRLKRGVCGDRGKEALPEE